MNKSYVSIAAGALTLSALAAIGIFSENQPEESGIRKSQVYTWDCEDAVQEPEAITLTCADGNMYIDQIDWSRWSADALEASAIYNVNDCNPNCAEGTFYRTPVDITITELSKFEGDLYLRNLVITTKGGENLPMTTSSSFQWDVMEFAEMLEK